MSRLEASNGKFPNKLAHVNGTSCHKVAKQIFSSEPFLDEVVKKCDDEGMTTVLKTQLKGNQRKSLPPSSFLYVFYTN